jgi:hypothetical protein
VVVPRRGARPQRAAVGIVNALSWARTDAEARQIAYDQWRTNVFDPPVCWDLQRHVAWLQDLDAFGEMSSRS